MCGIVAYVGKMHAQDIIIQGLQKLEYRGYDSSGICVFNNNKLNVAKKQGKLVNLINHLAENTIQGNIGIGHTRWATHGVPSDINAHPHISNNKTIAVVHNGIIENYQDLKSKLIDKGFEFSSTTDTEVVANLVEYYYSGNLLTAVQQALQEIQGAYAFVFMDSNNPNTLVVAKKDSPLLIGIKDNDFFIASDHSAIAEYSNELYYLHDYEIALITSKDNNGSINFFKKDNNNYIEIKKDSEIVQFNFQETSKNGYSHFMLKEIEEQPQILQSLLNLYTTKDNNIIFDNSEDLQNLIQNVEKIYITACGTAYFAGLCLANFLQYFDSTVQIVCEVASELLNKNYHYDANTLLIVISQSGETADSIKVIKKLKEKNVKVLSFVNTDKSSIARESNFVIYSHAGIEVAVASTKAFSAQVITTYLFAMYYLKKCNKISTLDYNSIIRNLTEVPSHCAKILLQKQHIEKIALKIYQAPNMFFIGKGLDFIIAQEASLKMKEISYIHSEAIASGELKHGYIALIQNNFPVVAIINDKTIVKKSLSSIQETLVRGAFNITLIQQDMLDENLQQDLGSEIIFTPNTHYLLGVFSSIVPLQLLSYFVSKHKGNDIDKPRNLAKSVTVE